MKSLQVVVFDESQTLTGAVADQLADRYEGVRQAFDAVDLAAALDGPCELLVVNLTEPPDRTLRAVQVVRDALPALPIVLVVDAELEGSLQEQVAPAQLVACGASALLSASSDRATIAAVLDRAALLAVRGRDWAKKLVNGTGPTTGQLHLVTSTGGGTGRTFVATSIAAHLSSLGRTTCIIDLDAPFGDVALALQTPTRFTVTDAIASEVDEVVEHLPRLCQKARPGLFVLSGAAPEAPIPTGRDARAVVAAARRIYDHVVVDAPHTPSPITNALLDDATDLWCVQTPDLGSVRAMALLLENLATAGVGVEQIRIVLNKYSSGLGVDLDEIALVLGVAPSLVIPHDLAVSHSLNHGEPLVLRDQKGTAEVLRAGLNEIIDVGEDAKARFDLNESAGSNSLVPVGWMAAGAGITMAGTLALGGLGWI